MRNGVYCIYDRKAHEHGTLFVHQNNLTAQRYFQHLCSLPANEVIRNDVELYRIGTFNSTTGELDVEHTYICDYASEVIDNEK